MAVLMSCLRDVTPRLSQKRRRGSPERTDEGYGDHLTRSLGSLNYARGELFPPTVVSLVCW